MSIAVKLTAMNGIRIILFISADYLKKNIIYTYWVVFMLCVLSRIFHVAAWNNCNYYPATIIKNVKNK